MFLFFENIEIIGIFFYPISFFAASHYKLISDAFKYGNI